MAAISALLLLAASAVTFWYEDWRYSLPTPRPGRLVQPAIGAPIDLARELPVAAGSQPVLLHFFNPDCPCSRFNLDHVRQLARVFGEQVRFVAVLEAPRDEGREAAVLAGFAALDTGLTPVLDRGGRLAAACGVYSTPQAVLVDRDARLFFRGNYNTSRYCTDPGTEFARLAILELLARRPAPAAEPAAAIAYGCELPGCASEAAPTGDAR